MLPTVQVGNQRLKILTIFIRVGQLRAYYIIVNLLKLAKNLILINKLEENVIPEGCSLSGSVSQYQISKVVGLVVMFSSIYHFFSCVQFLTTIYQFSRKQFNVFYQNAQSIPVEVWETFGPGGRLAPRGID